MQRFISWVAKKSPLLLQRVLDAFPIHDIFGVQVFSPEDVNLDGADKDVGSAENGSPVTHWITRIKSLDGQVASGVWDSSAGRHVIKFDFDEWVHILEGEAHVTALGVTRTLRAGDVAFFRAGLDMTWNVPAYVRKVWVHRYPRRGVLARVGARLSRLSRRP